MPGLLERAMLVRDLFQAKLDRRNAGTRGDGTTVGTGYDASEGVTPDERHQLNQEIEELFTGRKAIEGFAEGEYDAKHSGLTLPLIVNVTAIVILIAGIFGFQYLIAAMRTTDSQAATSYATTEGLVVQAVQKSAEQALSQRDARIAAIQRELERLRSAPPAQQNMGATNQREKELQDELNRLQASASGRLADLSAQKAQDTFFYRQLQSLYEVIVQKVRANDVSGALDGVKAADDLLKTAENSGSDSITALAPSVQTGNDAIRSALELELKTEQAAAAAAAQAAAASANASSSAAASSAAAGQAAQKAQTDAEARIAQQQAQIDRLTAQVRTLEQTVSTLRTAVAEGRARIAALQRSGAASEAARREQVQRINEQTARITSLQGQLTGREKQLAATQTELNELSSSVEAGLADLRTQTAVRKTTSNGNDAKILDLLNTKVTLRDAIDSPSVQSQFPDLSGQFDSFFDSYGRYYQQAGRQAALDEINRTVTRLDDQFKSRFGTQPAEAP